MIIIVITIIIIRNRRIIIIIRSMRDTLCLRYCCWRITTVRIVN